MDISTDTILTALSLAGIAVNVLVTLSIKLGIADVKLWVAQNYMTKKDHMSYHETEFAAHKGR